MMDDLRDYRFYESDMIHPNDTARQYIWGKFADRYFEPATQQLNEKISSIKIDLQHRPFRANSISHQKFLKETFRKAEELNKQINMDDELTQLKSQIL
jgi:hypothetical protein